MNAEPSTWGARCRGWLGILSFELGAWLLRHRRRSTSGWSPDWEEVEEAVALVGRHRRLELTKDPDEPQRMVRAYSTDGSYLLIHLGRGGYSIWSIGPQGAHHTFDRSAARGLALVYLQRPLEVD